MPRYFYFILLFSVVACSTETDEYFTPLGSDAVNFSKNLTQVETWYDQFNDTVTTIALDQGFFIEDEKQHFEIRTRFFFDSLYLEAEAFTQSQSGDIFGTKEDLVCLHFKNSLNGSDLLRSYVALFPLYKDTIFNEGTSVFMTDSFNWNNLSFYRSLILSSDLSDMQVVCDTTGSILAFETIDGRIYRPVNQ